MSEFSPESEHQPSEADASSAPVKKRLSMEEMKAENARLDECLEYARLQKSIEEKKPVLHDIGNPRAAEIDSGARRGDLFGGACAPRATALWAAAQGLKYSHDNLRIWCSKQHLAAFRAASPHVLQYDESVFCGVI